MSRKRANTPRRRKEHSQRNAADSTAERSSRGPIASLHDSIGNTAARSLLLTPAASPAVQRYPADREPDPSPASTEGNGPTEVTSPAADSAPAASGVLIVEDDAQATTPEQMRKSDFLAALKSSVSAAAQEALSKTIWSTAGCPWIDHWFERYREQDCAHLEAAIRKYAPEAREATAARDYIPIVTARVRRGIEQWAATGEIEDLPEELQGETPATGLIAAAGSLISSAVSALGAIFLKRRDEDALGVPDAQDQDVSAVQERLGSGHALESGVRGRMEEAFGYDLSSVRVHTDDSASKVADEMDARALTVGKDVAFAAGEYLPGTPIGDALIAHELAHVLQQGAASAGPSTGAPDISAYTALEEEADRAAASAIASTWGGLDVAQGPSRSAGRGISLQRCPHRAATTPVKTPTPAAPLTGWAKVVDDARSAWKRGDTATAENLYKQAILSIAVRVKPPPGVPVIMPTIDDIKIDFTLKDHAATSGPAVAVNPGNYWSWLSFGPDALLTTEAHTEAVIYHEMVHVGQYLKIWDAYNKDTSPTKGTWDQYRAPYDRRERVIGPDELEAHITSLDYLTRLKGEEEKQALEGIFVSYINTAVYVPPAGEAVSMTTAIAAPMILDFFNRRADDRLKQFMGRMLWRSLIRVDPPKDIWERVLRELKPVADSGMAETTFKHFYDDFLKARGIDYSKL